MWDQFSRTALLLGEAGMERLQRAHIAVFGLGGVGGWAAEALARSGVGTLTLVDDDRIGRSNLNRQIFALTSTIGRDKAEAARDRLLDINPEAVIYVRKIFFGPQTAEQFDFTQYSYIIDAIDTVTGKLELVAQARRAGTPVISSMGTGNKLHPAALEVADIYETSVCPLARVMRKELKRRGVPALKVVYSKEPPLPLQGRAAPEEEPDRGGTPSSRRSIPGSCAFVPPAAGLLIASEVVRDLLALPDGQPSSLP
ncbi:MAG: tRNA threonylcarbamoyladenosine dehydratase [Oscillibacter sp.]|nr:tRNA threonylcarbamoyladenosine dehydratase [Oscillibacter sp.]MCI9376484.1 tRNA threonylcarbamoyladenosine dehydratase [Oscillibacter sp.]